VHVIVGLAQGTIDEDDPTVEAGAKEVYKKIEAIRAAKSL